MGPTVELQASAARKACRDMTGYPDSTDFTWAGPKSQNVAPTAIPFRTLILLGMAMGQVC